MADMKYSSPGPPLSVSAEAATNEVEHLARKRRHVIGRLLHHGARREKASLCASPGLGAALALGAAAPLAAGTHPIILGR